MSRKRTTLWCVMLIIVVKMAGRPPIGSGHQATPDATLRKIGPAPTFSLTTQDSTRLFLEQLRGKVVVVTFIYTSCADTCPLLTAKMAGLQARLGRDLGSKVFFVAITVDPEQDTPVILKRYAETHGVDLAGWAFLTGTPSEIREVARQYGVMYTKRPRGDVDHTFLTSIVDTSGTLRVQYMGVRFASDAFLSDLHSLLSEGNE
jgi:protein SCO1/2